MKPARDFIRLSDLLRYHSNTSLSAASMRENGFESCLGTDLDAVVNSV